MNIVFQEMIKIIVHRMKANKIKIMNNTRQSVELAKVPQGRLGMWLLIAGELIIFGGLVCCYLLYRFRHPEWSEMAAHTSTMMGVINTTILLSSSFFAVMAHHYAVAKNKERTVHFMALTLVCGLAFLMVKGVEYYTEITHGFTLPGTHLIAQGNMVGSTYWAFYFLMTGLHGLHIIGGMTIIFLAMLQVKKGKNWQRVEIVGLYWHMVDLVWIFLFPLLYLAN